MTTGRSLEKFLREHVELFDVVWCLAVAVLSVALSGSMQSGVLSLALSLSLLLRRRAPEAALGLGALAALGQLFALGTPSFSIVAVPILIYSVARWSEAPLARTALLLGMVGSVLGPARWTLFEAFSVTGAVPAFGVLVLGCASIVAAAYTIGRRRRERAENVRERTEAEAQRQQLQSAEEEQRRRVAAVDERNRIARELHDIVAHSLSVIVVQAEGGRALSAKRPEQAAEVLGTIADTSREALEEMRRMVGLLRSGVEPDQASYLPTPGLGDIPELVRKTSDRAELTVRGAAPALSPALGLTAYRIVQESLTNVLKHAGPAAKACVTVTPTRSALELEVVDDGRGAAAQGDGHGHGVQGMAERVALHGGSFTAGPVTGGGYLVRASLPYEGDPASAVPASDIGPQANVDRRWVPADRLPTEILSREPILDPATVPLPGVGERRP